LRRAHFNRAATLALLVLASPLEAAPCPEGRAGRLAALTAGYALAEGAALAARQGDWWTTPRTGFYTVWDASPSAGQDRLLHAAIGYQVSQAGRAAFRWACVSEPGAAWLGAALGVAVALPKEIGDGFHEQKGFSLPDMLWTAAGSALPAAQRTWQWAGALALKGNYWPSQEYRNRTGTQPQLESDYAGQRYYLAVAPSRLLAVPWWPRWLGVAVGHSVPYWASKPPVHQWYGTLDIGFRELPVRGRWWRHAAWLLDQIHVPLPGVRLREGGVGLGLF
jgi:hypothetical protein